MDTKAVIGLVDELQEDLEDLEESLQSILTGSLATTSRKLPLLDRAKLNVLLVYSIESLLFSYLKIHGVQVKEHAVFKELTRVKQYFEKINAAEGSTESAQPAATLNKEAAARVIKHGLVCEDCWKLLR
jgi:exosome complex protein LRP1